MAQIQVNTGGGIGPGFSVTIITDFTGDIPSGSRWDIVVLDSPAHEVSALEQSELWTGAQQACTLGVRTQDNGVFPGSGTVAVGTPCVINATLKDPTGQQLDSGSSLVAPWSEAYVWWQTLLNQQRSAQGQGGLTQEEHSWLDDTQAAVQRVFTDVLGASLSSPIGGLIAHPDETFLEPDEPMTLVGRGALQRPAPGVGVNAYGLLLQVATHPAGFGSRDGAVIVWSERIAQLVALHAVHGGSTEWVTEIFDMHEDTIRWLWSVTFPSRILYDVTPGCSVHAEWILSRA